MEATSGMDNIAREPMNVLETESGTQPMNNVSAILDIIGAAMLACLSHPAKMVNFGIEPYRNASAPVTENSMERLAYCVQMAKFGTKPTSSADALQEPLKTPQAGNV